MFHLAFQKPDIGMRAAFEQLARQANTCSCQFAFPAVYCLQEKYGTELCLTEDAAFIRSLKRTAGRVEYFPPLVTGDGFARAVAAVERYAAEEGVPYAFFGLAQEQADMLSASSIRYRIEEDRDWAEYLYDTQPLATLEGSELKQKRKEARHCRNEYGEHLTVEPLHMGNLADALAFQREWMAVHDAQEEDTSLEGEDRAIQIAMAHFDALGLSGVLLRLDGRTVGYSYGCPVGRETYDILVQKAAPDVKFLYRVVFQESVRRCAMAYRYVNAEEDIGIPGLRALKLSYRPAFLLNKFRAIPEVDGA